MYSIKNRNFNNPSALSEVAEQVLQIAKQKGLNELEISLFGGVKFLSERLLVNQLSIKKTKVLPLPFTKTEEKVAQKVLIFLLAPSIT